MVSGTTPSGLLVVAPVASSEEDTAAVAEAGVLADERPFRPGPSPAGLGLSRRRSGLSLSESHHRK